MKKLLVLCGLFLLSGNAYALENCTAIDLNGPKASDVRSPNERFQVDNNMVYICDKNIGVEECDYDSVILYKDKAVYCKDQSGVTDTWAEKTIPDCTDDDYNIRLKNKTIKPCGGYLVSSYFVEEHGACVCKNSAGHSCAGTRICRPSEKYMKCQAAIERGEPAVWDANNKECHCHDRSGVEYNWSGDKCVEKNREVTKPTCPEGSSLDVISKEKCTSEQDFECTKFDDKGKCLCGKCTDKSSSESSLEKCLKSRSTTEGKACCYLPESVATWDGKDCNCVVNGTKFVIRDGHGFCEVDETSGGGNPGDGNPGDSTTPFECPTNILAIVDGFAISCQDNTAIMAVIAQIRQLCTSTNKDTNTFNTLWSALLALNPGQCSEQSVVQPPKQEDNSTALVSVRNRIISAHRTLRDMQSGFKRSVWRDKDGDFNTSRLLSDSIAGVVLGTAGGLITSNVVKKNQVEDGFEDIQCTIGGQVVATWGDEFRVGIQ